MRGRSAPIVAGLLALASSISVISGCADRNEGTLTMEALRSEHEPVEEIWNAAIRTSEDGRPRIHIDADVMRTYETEDSTYIVLSGDSTDERVFVRLFDETGKPSAVIQANSVVRHEAEGRYEARGNVEVVNVEGRRLESEELRWQEDERIIRSGGFVRIRTDTERIEGYALEATEDLNSYRLERVTGQVTLQDE